MIKICRTCDHDHGGFGDGTCDVCDDHSAWEEAQFVMDIQSEARERCAKYCETMAAYWAMCGNNTAEEAAKTLAMGIRGEGC